MIRGLLCTLGLHYWFRDWDGSSNATCIYCQKRGRMS